MARQKLEASRRTIAAYLGASAADFVFTGGGTDSNNLALIGLLRRLPAGPKHVVTSTIEHPAVSEALRSLESEGVAISYAGVNSDCLVDPDEIRALLRPETVLVSIMHANNETGAIQPIPEIGGIVKERRASGQTIYFHSDGVQAFGKIAVDVDRLGVDLYAVSAHKVYAPKGVGGLYVRAHVPLGAIHFGGRHERSRRAGTENVPGAVAFAKAVELCANDDAALQLSRRNDLETVVTQCSGCQVVLNGPHDHRRLPNTTNLQFAGISAEALVIGLDMQGFAVSTGSACSSGSIAPSHVLLAMGKSREDARSCVRFSLGRYNSDADIRALKDAVLKAVARLTGSRRLHVASADQERHVAVL